MSILQEAFDRFDQENPDVYALLLKYAAQAKAAGREKFGIGMIWERLRWYTMVETTDTDFKLNNNHRAFYARKIMAEHPEYRGFFEIRAQRM